MARHLLGSRLPEWPAIHRPVSIPPLALSVGRIVARTKSPRGRTKGLHNGGFCAE